jgi:hypothetical protein
MRTPQAVRRTAAALVVIVVCGLLFVGPLSRATWAHLGETTFASVIEPIGIAATPGRLLVTRPLCGDPRQVLAIDDAGAASVFATLPARGGGCFEDYIAVAGPADLSRPGFPSPTKGDFVSNDVFVTQGPKILKISLGGVVSTFTTISGCGPSRTGITFDRVGTFGYAMIVTCETGKVWKVAASGAATLIADVAAALGLAAVRIENPDVAPDTFAPYGGHIVVAAEVLSKVFAISPAGVVKAVAQWPAAEGVNTIPGGKCNTSGTRGAFFTAIFRPAASGPGTIVRFPLDALKGLSGRLLVTSQGSAGIGLLTSTGASTITPTLFHANIGKHEGSAFTDCAVPLILKIIVKPGSIPHTINPTSGGTVPVVILSTSFYNALTDTVLSSIRFGFTGTENSIASCNKSGQDFNGDGRLDLLCHGDTKKLGIPGTEPYRGPLIVKLEYIGPGGDPPGEGLD